MEAEMVVAGKPPKLPFSRAKRHNSLHSAEAIARFNKLRKHNSQPKLHKGPVGGSVANLNLESRKRSSSYAHLEVPLTANERTLSASNLAAVSDPSLSVKEAIPKRSYDQPSYSFFAVKKHFDNLVKRYFHQLTEGCGGVDCKNAFCFSNVRAKKFSREIAGIVSIELASRNTRYFCNQNDVTEPASPLPQNLFEGEPRKPRPFLHCLFSSSPFQSLFEVDSEKMEPTKQNSSCYSSRESLGSGCVEYTQGNEVTGSLLALESKTQTGDATDNKAQEKVCEIWSQRKSSSNTSLSDLKNEQRNAHLTFDQEFSKLNLSGNLLSESGLVSLPSDLRGSNSSLNEHLTLEEFEKECALEMSAGHIQEFSLTHLTIAMLESSIKNYTECGDPAFLVNTLRTVFTTPEALNTSFLKEGEGTDALDVVAVKRAFSMILKLQPQETFVPPLLNATEIHLAALDSTVIIPGEVNQLIILMENPLVQKSQGLLRKLCQVLHQTTAKTRQAVVDILSCYDEESFWHLHQVFQDYLGNMVHPKQSVELHLVEICSILSLFFDAHKESARQKMSRNRPLSQLYSDDLSRKMDFKKEYEHWRSLSGSVTTESERMSLLDFPFLLDPMSKVRVLHLDAVWQMRAEYQNAIVHQARVQQAQKVFDDSEKPNKLEDSVKSAMCPFLVLEIRRDRLVEDTLHQINQKEADLKKPLKIKYVGGGEQGLDMGGLQKEFFHMIVDAVFDPNNGMFTYVEESRHIWINGSSLESEEEYALVGILLGLAIYNGVILDIRFPRVIYKKLQGGKPDLEDLTSLQPSLAKSLQELLDYEGDVENTFCCTFQVSSASYGGVQSVELIPNGAEIAVTNDNRQQFVDLYVRYLLVDSVANQFDPFFQGFHKVCGGAALTLFRPDELELLVCGCPVVDFHELELAASYEDGYYPDHPTMKIFWQTVREMSLEQKKALLMFVTGSDRVPLKGLANITFIIQSHGPDSERLPSALTCFNRLLLPEYHTKKKLKERLIVAVENCKGFGLT